MLRPRSVGLEDLSKLGFNAAGGEIEGAVRVADIHHDAHRRLWQGVELDALLLEVEAALVDDAGVALGA